MGALRISPDQLDGLERIGMRFGWRARLIATGEPVSDHDLRAMMNRRLLSGDKREWVTEHFVNWPPLRPGDPRAEALRELQNLYETDDRIREEFASADSRRALEKKWVSSRKASTKPDAVEQGTQESAEGIFCRQAEVDSWKLSLKARCRI